MKRTGCTTTFFSAPPADCPPSIVSQWRQLTDTGDVVAAGRGVIEAAKQKQHEQKENDRVGLYSTIFGKK
jgi:hypothetical protein